jgi:hypothetical protein
MRQMLCCQSLTQTTAFFTATKRVCGVKLKIDEIFCHCDHRHHELIIVGLSHWG